MFISSICLHVCCVQSFIIEVYISMNCRPTVLLQLHMPRRLYLVSMTITCIVEIIHDTICSKVESQSEESESAEEEEEDSEETGSDYSNTPRFTPFPNRNTITSEPLTILPLYHVYNKYMYVTTSEPLRLYSHINMSIHTLYMCICWVLAEGECFPHEVPI